MFASKHQPQINQFLEDVVLRGGGQSTQHGSNACVTLAGRFLFFVCTVFNDEIHDIYNMSTSLCTYIYIYIHTHILKNIYIYYTS